MIGANFEEYHVDPSEFTYEGDRVVVTGRFKGKNKGGAELDTCFTHIFDMRDEKVVRFENKPDDAQAWAAAGPPDGEPLGGPGRDRAGVCRSRTGLLTFADGYDPHMKAAVHANVVISVDPAT